MASLLGSVNCQEFNGRKVNSDIFGRLWILVQSRTWFQSGPLIEFGFIGRRREQYYYFSSFLFGNTEAGCLTKGETKKKKKKGREKREKRREEKGRGENGEEKQ